MVLQHLRGQVFAAGLVLTGFAGGSAFAAALNEGDVFAAIGNGQVQHYDSSLNLIETLNTGLGGFTTGMAFDAAGNLYVTNFSANSVSRFAQSNGALLGTFGSGYATPESIVFDAAGNVYVGNVGGGIRKFDSAGTPLQNFAVGRVDFIDLSADQKTMLWTTEGSTIQRIDVSTNTILSNFTNSASNAFALRILPDGTVLLADGVNVKRFDASGNVIQTYDVASVDNFFALNLNIDGTSFFSGSFGNSTFYQFDIASGAVLDTQATGCGGSCFFGLAVAGEPTVAGPPDDPNGTIPEPATLVLLGSGLLGLALVRRRTRSA